MVKKKTTAKERKVLRRERIAGYHETKDTIWNRKAKKEARNKIKNLR